MPDHSPLTSQQGTIPRGTIIQKLYFLQPYCTRRFTAGSTGDWVASIAHSDVPPLQGFVALPEMVVAPPCAAALWPLLALGCHA